MKIHTITLSALSLCAALTCNASVILGVGNDALIGGDLTDPENDGAVDADTGYNAVFAASSKENFGPPEGAFNVFDNRIGGGNDKWCCGNDPNSAQWVQATFDQPMILSGFTLASGNDTPGRDPVNWQIQGSNDGVNFVNIFSNTDSNVWTARNQVISWSVEGGDFSTPAGYTTLRMNTDSTGLGGGAFFQLNEIEFFGTAVPEPSVFSLFGLAGLGLFLRRRR